MTGATGYLGSLLARRLAENNHTLGCVVRHPERLGRLEPLRKRLQLISAERLEDGIASFRPEIVIHTAAAYSRGGNTERDVIEGNLLYPLRVMQAVRDTGIVRWINTDTMLPPALNSYAFTKKQFAQWGAYYAGNGEFEFINLVLEHFYGPDAPEDNFLSWVIQKLNQNVPVDLTLGTQKRDFIHVENVLDVYEAVLNYPVEEPYWKIEVGTGAAPAIREVVEYLKAIMNSKSTLNFGAVPMRKHEPDSCCDVTALLQLGIGTPLDWQAGMKLLVNHMKK